LAEGFEGGVDLSAELELATLNVATSPWKVHRLL